MLLDNKMLFRKHNLCSVHVRVEMKAASIHDKYRMKTQIEKLNRECGLTVRL